MKSTKHSDSVLLVMDMQQKMMEGLSSATSLLQNVRAALFAARASGVRVIYVSLCFRSGYPELGLNNHSFSAIQTSGDWFTVDHPSSKIHPLVAPMDTDIQVVKKRYSAFCGNDLELLLRAMNVKKLTLCGFATSGVVLSTVRAAADLDYNLTVLDDACADSDPQIHQFLVQKIFSKQAAVVHTADWIAALK